MNRQSLFLTILISALHTPYQYSMSPSDLFPELKEISGLSHHQRPAQQDHTPAINEPPSIVITQSDFLLSPHSCTTATSGSHNQSHDFTAPCTQNPLPDLFSHNLFNVLRPWDAITATTTPSSWQTPIINEMTPSPLPSEQPSKSIKSATLINMLVTHVACIISISHHTSILIEEHRNDYLKQFFDYVPAKMKHVCDSKNWHTNNLLDSETLLLFMLFCFIKAIHQKTVVTENFHRCLYALEIIIQNIGYQEISLLSFDVIKMMQPEGINRYYQNYLEQQRRSISSLLEIIRITPSVENKEESSEDPNNQAYSELIVNLYQVCLHPSENGFIKQNYIYEIMKQTPFLFNNTIHALGKNKLIEQCTQAQADFEEFCLKQGALSNSLFFAKLYAYFKQQVMFMSQGTYQNFIDPIIKSYKQAVYDLCLPAPNYSLATVEEVGNLLSSSLSSLLTKNFHFILRTTLYKAIQKQYCLRIKVGSLTLQDIIDKVHIIKNTSTPTEVFVYLDTYLEGNKKTVSTPRTSTSKRLLSTTSTDQDQQIEKRPRKR